MKALFLSLILFSSMVLCDESINGLYQIQPRIDPDNNCFVFSKNREREKIPCSDKVLVSDRLEFVHVTENELGNVVFVLLRNDGTYAYYFGNDNQLNGVDYVFDGTNIFIGEFELVKVF